jgi:hypothetical protein
MNRTIRSAAVAALLAASACGGPASPVAAPAPGSAGTSSSSDFTARLPRNSLGGIPTFSLSVSLFDAPLTFGTGDKVNLALLGVNLVSADGASHPIVAFPKPVVVDLLTLKKAAKKFDTTATAGSYSAVEFILLPSLSSVEVSGTRYPARFGSGEIGSPVPIALDSPVVITGANKAKVKVAIDFNALESVSLADGVAQIDPHFVSSTDDSQVHGSVRNGANEPVAGATVLVEDAAGTPVNTTVTSDDGSFVVHALSAGAYTVAVSNDYTSASGVTVSARGATSSAPPSVAVQLAPGVDIDLGTLRD